jgi:hypothetical protein
MQPDNITRHQKVSKLETDLSPWSKTLKRTENKHICDLT